jgi:hypothetical protein
MEHRRQYCSLRDADMSTFHKSDGDHTSLNGKENRLKSKGRISNKMAFLQGVYVMDRVAVLNSIHYRIHYRLGRLSRAVKNAKGTRRSSLGE